MFSFKDYLYLKEKHVSLDTNALKEIESYFKDFENNLVSKESEKGIESQKKQYGAGATQTEEEKEAAKEKYYGRKKIWSKRPTSIQILKKSHKKYRENNPEKVKQASLNWLNKPGNLEKKTPSIKRL